MITASDPIDLFAGEGEVRAACRAKDWSATPLGPESSWSPALRSSLLHVLWSAFPNVVLWGPGLVQLFNEAYLDLIGGDGLAALGCPPREASTHGSVGSAPLFQRVFAGETISREGAAFPVTRSGRTEQLYLTLSYAPIHDEHAMVAGVLVTVFEAEAELAVAGRPGHHDIPPRLSASARLAEHRGMSPAPFPT